MNEVPAAEELCLESVVAQLADEFGEQLERGEEPNIEDYASRYPPFATVICQVLSSLLLIYRTSPPPGGPPMLLPPLLEVGCLGDFRILREVGRGGMGVVYEAEQISLRRKVALKVLPFAAVLDPRQLQRFQNEAQAAACLHHTNIVPVFAVGSERGVHYYAMQFIDGHSLADLIEHRRQLLGKSISLPLDPDANRPTEKSPGIRRPLPTPPQFNDA